MNSKIKIIAAMLIFGSIGIFVKKINLPSIEIAFLRAVIGSLFLIMAAFFIRQRISYAAIKKNAVFLILSGTAIGFNWILLFQAYKYTTISTATLSYYFAPVFVVMLAPFILKEKLTLFKSACVAAAMIGLFLILNSGGNDINGSYNHLKGIMFGISGAALYASAVLMNKFIRNLSGFETTLVQLSVAAVVLFVSIIYQGNLNLTSISHVTWIYILIVGIAHTGIAYLLYFTAIKELNSQSIAILSYIDPISAVVFATLFLGEGMTYMQILGGVLILGSTFFSERVNISRASE